MYLYQQKNTTQLELNRGTGFTLLELLVVMSLVSLLAVIAAPSYNNMRKNVALDTQRQEIVSALRTAQQRSIASRGFEPHGIHFGTDSFSMFSPSYSTTFELQGDIEFIDGENSDVIFDRLTGEAAIPNPVIVSVGYAGGTKRAITISESGAISSL